MNTYLQRVRDAIADATRGMTAEQLTRHPAEGKWSAAEILEHLSRAYKTSIPHLQKCLDGGEPLATAAGWKQRVIATVVVDMGYMPSGRKAPEFTRPKGAPVEQVLQDIPQHLTTLDQVLSECERRFGATVKLADHPILGPLTVNQWRKFHWVHTRHHLKQIARLRRLES